MVTGAHIVVFTTSLYYIIRQKTGSQLRWIIYLTAIFVSSTIYSICVIYADELIWIGQRNFPGGPLAFIEQRETHTTQAIIGQSSSIVCLALTDALLVRLGIFLIVTSPCRNANPPVVNPLFRGVGSQMVDH